MMKITSVAGTIILSRRADQPDALAPILPNIGTN